MVCGYFFHGLGRVEGISLLKAFDKAQTSYYSTYDLYVNGWRPQFDQQLEFEVNLNLKFYRMDSLWAWSNGPLFDPHWGAFLEGDIDGNLENFFNDDVLCISVNDTLDTCSCTLAPAPDHTVTVIVDDVRNGC